MKNMILGIYRESQLYIHFSYTKKYIAQNYCIRSVYEVVVVVVAAGQTIGPISSN